MKPLFVRVLRTAGLLIAAGVSAGTVLVAPARAQAPIVGNFNPARDIGIDQNLNALVPLDLAFRDEAGRPVRLGDYFGKKPVVLALVYYKCPRLCQLMLDGVVRSLQEVKYSAGTDFQVIAVSIDPRETPAIAADKRREMLELYARPGSERGWHFLTGEEKAIAPLARAVGFRYRYDPGTKQYAHAAGIQILTPQGRVARYLNGIDYPAKSVGFALIESSRGKVGTVVDKALLMTCFAYNPETGKYGFAIMKLLQASGIATVLILATFMLVMFRMDRRRALEAQAARLPAPGGAPEDGHHG